MKILVAIKSSGRPDEMAHTTYRWAARAGFDLRVFCPKAEADAYRDALDDAAYHYWLVGRDENEIVTAGQPLAYARRHGYDLLCILPDNLLDYKTVRDDDKSMLEFAADVGTARKRFGNEPELRELPLENGCLIKRVQ